MKKIHEIRYYTNIQNNKSKHISAYKNKKTAINQMKKLNAQYGPGAGDPFFVVVKIIDD